MTLAIVKSRALFGLNAPEVTVEVYLAHGLPSFTIVGLPDTEVKESRDRVRCAIQSSHLEFPTKRITVNLAPADLPKASGRFDLPIALGILAASEQIPIESLARYEFAGELSLSGQLRPIHSALAMAYAVAQQPSDKRAFILPKENADEAALIECISIYSAPSLLAVCQHLKNDHTNGNPDLCIQAFQRKNKEPIQIVYPDMSDIKGQAFAKRALEIAAAGKHHLLLVGPPGAGKSMLASRFPGILPPMTRQESLESAALLSLSATVFDPNTWGIRSYRTPHHSASAAALIGGGSYPKPGEISLAHHGVLFLDEIAEFDRKTLDMLREPMETHKIAISRVAGKIEFPAEFQLIAAMNPCPCGYFGHQNSKCRCSPESVQRYQGRLSGPLIDRIDMHLEVSAVPIKALSDLHPPGESSLSIRQRVCHARERQFERQQTTNQALHGKEIENYCISTADALALLHKSLTKLPGSARAYHRILKVARTIADLDGAAHIDYPHMAEAIQYRYKR